MPFSNIVLIGMPGSGKTTVGRALAKRLRKDFLDTDRLIEAFDGRPLQEIIDQDGNEAFRRLEARVIRRTAVSGHVIATGGSVVYDEDAMEHLRDNGEIVFLDVPCTSLVARLSNSKARGISMAPGQTITELYAERLPLYEWYAGIVLDCDRLSVERIVDALAKLERPAKQLKGKSADMLIIDDPVSSPPWECPHCHFENAADAERCRLCNTEKADK